MRDADGSWLFFRKPHRVLCARSHDAVISLLEEVQRSGMWAAGYVAYEAAPAFDAALPAKPPGGPLAWFGLYEEPVPVELPGGSATNIAWQCDISEGLYFDRIARIKEYISEGDTYQVNYTFRLNGRVGDPWHFFLSRMAGSRFSAYIHAGETIVCSASPELFFELDGNAVTCRPMKGTARRTCELESSAKDRAENVMIVDMIRNDLGRICVPGSIIADPLFEVEPIGDIRQMTSTVRGRSNASITEIFKALFPCASITGAPKRRTMQIIKEVEDSPRCVYCGAIGYIAPGRKARFSVAIRTVAVDRDSREAVYGVGGGIVWDSRAEAEWNECALKAEVLGGKGNAVTGKQDGSTCPEPAEQAEPNSILSFQLLETILFDGGIAYLDQHIERLARSAGQLGLRLDMDELRGSLDAVTGGRQRLRLLLSRDGEITIESFPFPEAEKRVRKLCFARDPVDPDNLFLYHKTTHRDIYDNAKAAFPDMDDVILWNGSREVTESTIANIVVRLDGQLVTPPVSCGLLPGTMRAALLKEGRITERVITRDELRNAEEIFLVNSLRGWMPAELVEQGSVS